MALTFDKSMLELDEGLLADVIILFENIEDTLEKAIAQYLYPYADGADLEDMGQKPHTLRFKCWFWDDAEQQSYNTHTLLLDALKDKNLLDFVHPKYGLMQGKILSIVVQHDDQERCASLDINFIEQGRVNIEGAAPEQVQSAVEDAYIIGQEQQESTLLDDIKAYFLEDAAFISDILDEGEGLLEQAQEYGNEMRAFVKEVEGYIATGEAVVNTIVSPVNSLQATITYTPSLPGRILGSIAASAEKAALLNTSLQNMPNQFISKLDTAFDNLQDAFDEFGSSGNSSSPSSYDSLSAKQAAQEVMTTHLQIACAQRMALEVAAIYARESLATADPASDPDFQVMNINELEATLAIVRTRLEAAVEKAREMDSLKIMAVSLLNHVNNVRLEREKMVKVALDNPMPLHLVCLKQGLPYQDAERLIRVNNIPAPNFTSGEVMVYVR